MTDWIEIIALVAGPVFAVGLTLWREKVTQQRERRLMVMRQFLFTRSMPDDAAFSIAVALVPIDFGDDDPVMTTWETFKTAAAEQRATDGMVNDLAEAMMLCLGFKARAAKQVAESRYVSKGLGEQRELNALVLKGVLDLAKSSRLSSLAARAVAEHVTGHPLAEQAEQ